MLTIDPQRLAQVETFCKKKNLPKFCDKFAGLENKNKNLVFLKLTKSKEMKNWYKNTSFGLVSKEIDQLID